ncbi:HD domain-containing protein [Chitinophaga sp. RAB17]|uniref:HD domain-containing protein n=1 Tax=Chitinophaga sp. RAB17 TaxID=3233049 RepID=UPI003F934FD2
MQVSELRAPWTQTNFPYTDDLMFINQSYVTMMMAYQEEKRHYHDISHILQLVSLQQAYTDRILDNEVVLFSIFFHDIIYNAQRSDNEEMSAAAAVTHLRKIGFPAEKTTAVNDFIIATKTHINPQNNPDLDYFLDFDLQILGASPEAYQQYTRQIRQEYSIYPDLLYKPGRKRVLQHFLEMPAIFRTPVFRELYEESARNNIQAEIDTL